MGSKSVSLGAMPSFPAHLGSARPMTEVGSWLADTSLVLKTMPLTRAEIPTQSPTGEL